MVNISTDTHTFTITVIRHADLEISNPLFPAAVEIGEDFNIAYDITNNGANDLCYGLVRDTDTGTIISGSEWQENISAGDTDTKAFTVIGGISDDLNAEIEVGYVK